MEQRKDKLTIWQVLVRVISVVVCAIGASTCLFSLSLQIEEIGTSMSSIVWFSGLACVVASLGGYASACNPRQGTSFIPLAVAIGAVLAIALLMLELDHLRSYDVALCAIASLLIEAALLIAFRFILKRNDPDAL